MSGGPEEMTIVKRWTTRDWLKAGIAVVLLLGLAACDQPNDKGQTVLEIDGTYTDEFGTMHVITDTQWKQTYSDAGNSTFCGGPTQNIVTDTYSIALYSNSEESLFTQNTGMVGDCSLSNENLWSRYDWATYQDHLYYCQTAFSAATLAAAQATARSDDTNPSVGGCGGSFAWTRLD
jgi:hypothetical protein